VSIYGLFADPATIATQLNSLTEALPRDARKVITDQVTMLAARRAALSHRPHHRRRHRVVERIRRHQQPAQRSQCGLRRGRETRLYQEAAVVTRTDYCRHRLHGDHAQHRRYIAGVAEGPCSGRACFRWVFQILGWLILVVLVMVALAIVYRLGPERDAPKMKWVSVGALVATADLARCLDRLFYLLVTFRQLRQDLWRFRRHRGAALLALAHRVRDLARRRDQR
jgi:membrane protein